MSAGAGAPGAGADLVDLLAHCLGAQLVAVEQQSLAIDLRPAQHRRRLGHRGDSCIGRAANACHLGRGLASPAFGVQQLSSGVVLDVGLAQMVAECDRELRRHDRLLDPERLDHAAAQLAVDLAGGSAAADQLIAAELVPEQALEIRCSAGDPIDLERVGQHRTTVAGLQIQERVADRDRHLVAHRRRGPRVAVDENIHSGKAGT